MDNTGKNGLEDTLVFLYGKERGTALFPRLLALLEEKRPRLPQRNNPPGLSPISNKDALLISYGDMLSGDTGTGLSRLFRFLEKRNGGTFSYLHLLPFHPYSSDDGFSVIDYRRVDERFGSWDDLEKFGNPVSPKTEKLKLAFDLVINHGSLQSRWFQGFLQDEEQYQSWYITRPADYDSHSVVRPRTHPLLTAFKKQNGETIHVWTTFSADQVDYDFSNPEVLLEFARILLEYAARGAGIIRLDAIAYLWKEDGTPCLHHPKTHAVVKLFRAMVDYLGLPLLILTETNVPHEENISYFGSPVGNAAIDSLPEAHLVYNFALPPLVLYAALSGDAGPLRNWAGTLPPTPFASSNKAALYFLNFLASHDGVGLTPVRGLVDEAAFAEAIEEARRRGALVSYKSTPEGDVPYELNCSYASLVAPETMGDTGLRARAFLAAHGVLFSLSGLPAVYFHSWIGSSAWNEGPGLLGYNRAINREKPAAFEVERELEDPESFRFQVYQGMRRLLLFRQNEAVFHPDAAQRVLAAEGSLFVLLRGTETEGRWALCLENLGSEAAVWTPPAEVPAELGPLKLESWETRWLVYDKNGLVKEISTVNLR
ncbi:sucrose phosphorylase [Spirochaetia bacterium]|nr:sucrose phosphorylase [Spirochaetia bacterium]